MKNLRSYLMVAGDKEKHLNKIDELQCDAAMINLEDGVGNKEEALLLLKKIFKKTSLREKNKFIIVRINPLNESGLKEIRELNHLKPHAIRIPKIKTQQDIQDALKFIDDDIEIHLSIETKEGFENLKNFKLDRRVTTVYLGILDLLESLNLPQSLIKLDNPMIEYILSRFLIDSKIIGFKPIFFTYQEYKNEDEFVKWLLKGKSIGYEATSCISPGQVNIANEIFKKDEDELEKAKYIIKIFEENRDNGITGFSDLKFGFIDEPIYKNAKQILKNF